MMKTIFIVGAGMNAQSITQEGMAAINQAEVLFGSERLIEPFKHLDKPAYALYKPADVQGEIEKSEMSRFTVLVSGDVGFFSGAAALCESLKGYDVRLIPGISSAAAFSAKLAVPWQDFKLVSMHGIPANIVELVRRNSRVLCLTGGNAAEIGRKLTERGFSGVTVYAGENLGYEDEKITKMTAAELSGSELALLTTLLIINENIDGRARSGIPDDEFIRLNGIPMTKCEIRAVVSSKLALSPGAVCYDAGAGTGSVSVEMALSAYEGQVFAIEQDEKALPLIEENLTKFNIGNVTAVCGKAPDAFSGLPAPDAAFIGGSSGEMGAIIDTLVEKNPNVRIVVTAVTLESAAAALAALKKTFPNTEAVQISAARIKPAGELSMMAAQNPVTIISGGGL